MMRIEELIARLKAATEGGRELDFLITKAAGLAPDNAVWGTEQMEKYTELNLDLSLPNGAAPPVIFDDGWETPEFKANRTERRAALKALRHSSAEEVRAWFDEHPDPEYDWEKSPPRGAVQRFTTSLDAAMTLVPEGWTADVRRYASGKGLAGAWDHEHLSQSKDLFELEAATPALALCIAAMKARASQQENHQ